MSLALVRYHPATNGALFRLRGMLLELEKTVRGLEREYASDVDKLRQFERRFRPAVGDRYDELERLRARINRGWQALGEAQEGQTVASAPDPDGIAERPRVSAAPGRRGSSDLSGAG